jgi:DNA-binding winged helix-turn-helix (wHTH) protein/tetratricopeptide (TPR) repeat protein
MDRSGRRGPPTDRTPRRCSSDQRLIFRRYRAHDGTFSCRRVRRAGILRSSDGRLLLNVAAKFPLGDPTIVLAHERPFRLGAVEVRPGTREVVGPGGREVLEPRVMQVLVALARAGGETVSRDDLVLSCWDGRAVGEDAISRVISRLRRLTEGVGREGWTLETITKVGYRLTPAGCDLPSAPAAPAPGSAPSRRLLIGGAVATAVAAGGVGAWLYVGRPKGSPLARQLVEKAQETLDQGTPDTTLQAIAFLRQAVADSPDYAGAWGALALAYQANMQFTEPARQPALLQLSQQAAQRGLELDGDDDDAATAMAVIRWSRGDWLELERRMTRGSVLEGDVRFAWSYSRLLMEVGRMREAVRPLAAAVRREPLAPWARYSLGLAQWAAGRTEEAERTAREGLELFPRQHPLWFLLFNILTFTGRAAEALAFSRDPAYRPGTVPQPDVELSLAVARAFASGAAADVDQAVAVQLAAARRGIGYAENAMSWTAALGRLDDAFAVANAIFFDRGFVVPDQRFSPEQGRFNVAGSRPTHQLFMPVTASMRRDPRFGPLASELGLLTYWRQSGHLPDDPNVARLVAPSS